MSRLSGFNSPAIHPCTKIRVDNIAQREAVENRDLVADFLYCWISLLADSPIRHTTHKNRYVHMLLKAVERDGLKNVVLFYSSLCDDVMASCHNTGTSTTTGTYFGDVFKNTPVFQEYLAWYKDGSPVVLKWLMSFLKYGKKMAYHDEAFFATAFGSWLGVEEKLRTHSFGDLENLKTIVRCLLNNINHDLPFLGRHGPGQVADNLKGKIEKSEKMTHSSTVRFAYHRENIINHPRGMTCYPDQLFPNVDPHNASGIVDYSELLFVPKNLKTARSICKEPAGYMFFQQHYSMVLRTIMDNSRISRFVTIHDQTPNQKLSDYGSWSNNVDTIDLSAASDSVSLKMIKTIFPRKVLYNLLATRSKGIKLPNGTIMSPEKFAPMGSALCFPVQCIVFTAIVVHAHLMHRYNAGYEERFTDNQVIDLLERGFSHTPLEFKTSRLYEPFVVYGDDIVCDSKVTDRVLHALRTYGFSPNDSKSFMGSQSFRESCGKFHWCGNDVTPVHFTVKTWSGRRSASSFASIIDNCNEAGDAGYKNLYRMLVARTLHVPLDGVQTKNGKNPVLFSSNRDTALSIWHPAPRNEHLAIRRYEIPKIEKDWGKLIRHILITLPGNHPASPVRLGTHQAYQRDELKSIRVRPSKHSKSLSNSMNVYEHTQWWRAAWMYDSLSPQGDNTFKTSLNARLCWGWTPAEA